MQQNFLVFVVCKHPQLDAILQMQHKSAAKTWYKCKNKLAIGFSVKNDINTLILSSCSQHAIF